MEGGFTGYKSDFTLSGYKSEKVKAVNLGFCSI